MAGRWSTVRKKSACWEFIPTRGAASPPFFAAATEKQRQNPIGTLPAIEGRASLKGPTKGRLHMFIAADPRQIAASLAAAFVTAMLFVSAAVGPLPIA